MVPSKLRSLNLRLRLLNKLIWGISKKAPRLLIRLCYFWSRENEFGCSLSQLCSSPISVIVGDKSNQSTIRGSAQNKLQLELLKSNHLIGLFHMSTKLEVRLHSEYSNTQREQGFTTAI